MMQRQQRHGMAHACVTACLTLHVLLSAMPRGSVSRSLAPLVALASPLSQGSMSTRHAAHLANTWHHGLHHGPTSLACFPCTAVTVPCALSTADLATSLTSLLSSVDLRDAHAYATTNRALTSLEDNPNQHHLWKGFWNAIKVPTLRARSPQNRMRWRAFS